MRYEFTSTGISRHLALLPIALILLSMIAMSCEHDLILDLPRVHDTLRGHDTIFSRDTLRDSIFIDTSSNNGGDTVTGDIAGIVWSYETDCRTFNAQPGVKITVLGTSFQTTSDGKGMFEISGLPTGVYRIKAELDSHSTVIQTNVQHIGRGKTYLDAMYLYKMTTEFGVLDSLYIEPDGVDGLLHFRGHIAHFIPNTINQSWRLFISKQAMIDPMDASTFETQFNWQSDINGKITAGYTTLANLKLFGFESGDTLFAAAFAGGSCAGPQRLYDFETREEIYPGVLPKGPIQGTAIVIP